MCISLLSLDNKWRVGVGEYLVLLRYVLALSIPTCLRITQNLDMSCPRSHKLQQYRECIHLGLVGDIGVNAVVMLQTYLSTEQGLHVSQRNLYEFIILYPELQDRNKRIKVMKDLIKQLPLPNRETLKELLLHLTK